MGLQAQPLLCAGLACSRGSPEPSLAWSLDGVRHGKERAEGGRVRPTLPFGDKRHDEN